MTQIPHNKRLAYIIERMKELDIRFPIADIGQKTGMDKGNVSKILSGVKPVSEKFWERFVKSYGDKPLKLPQENEIIKKLDEIIELLTKGRKF